MSTRIGEHLRSNVFAYLVLFLAVTVVPAVAATSLPKNSVKSKTIKDGQVKTKDVKDNGLTGVDIDESTLSLPSSGGSGAASDLNCSGCVAGAEIADAAITIAKLAFDPATQAELNSLAADDGSPPNTGANLVHWNALNGVPAGFADGVDDTGGTASDLNCSGCVANGELANAYWQLNGNAATNPATNFLGTTDNQPLHLRVNNARALRLEPASDGTNQAPNLIGGSADNTVSAGVHSATISGGGRSSPSLPATGNRVTDNFGTIGGGANNQAGDNGGTVNDRPFSTVSGGQVNTASGAHATVGGGFVNTASGTRATVGGGVLNTASGDNATVAGGDSNIANENSATVGGGSGNTASGTSATVAGGFFNTASGISAAVGSGQFNTASGLQATAPGGISNTASGQFATVGGGENNTANGSHATVPGGAFNEAEGDSSFVTGRRAKNLNAAHDGVFLFADSTDVNFDSAAANEFAARATGGFRFVASAGGNGCTIAAGSGDISCTSDRHAKEDFAPVSPREVLSQLARLPIESWIYGEDPEAVRHIGPTAQAFKRTFGIGEDPTKISTVDADGIALAAIKGLASKVRAQRERLAELERTVARLDRRR